MKFLKDGDKSNKIPAAPPAIYLGYVYAAIFLLFWLFTCAAIPGLFSGGYNFAGIFCLTLAVLLPWKFTGYFAELIMEHRLANVTCDQVSSLKRSYARMIGVWSRLPLQKGRFFLLSNSNLAVLELCDGDYERGMERFKAVNEKAQQNIFFRNSDLNRLFAFNFAQSLLRLEYFDQCERFIAREVNQLSQGDQVSQDNQLSKVNDELPTEVVQAQPASTPTDQAKPAEGRFSRFKRFGRRFSRRQRKIGSESWLDLRGLVLAGTLYTCREENEKAIVPLERALAIMEKKSSLLIFPVSQVLALVGVHSSLALCKLRMGLTAEGLVNCDEAIALLPGVYRSGFFLQMLNSQVKLAECLMDNQQYDRANAILQYSYAAARLTPYHVDAQDVLLAKERLLILTGRSSEIADMKTWVLPLEIEPV